MFVFDCQLIARHGGITKLSMGEYPGNSRQASHFCVVKKNWQFSLSAKILQIASCTQKHLAHPDSQRIMCARLARDHQTHPQRLLGSIFEQAGLNVCFRLPTYREARRHHKAQHGEYPGNSRQASHFCIVQKNRQFSLSAKILQIASCTQKHLAHPDCQRIMCALPGTISPSVRIWENYVGLTVSSCQHIARHRNIRNANSRHSHMWLWVKT